MRKNLNLLSAIIALCMIISTVIIVPASADVSGGLFVYEPFGETRTDARVYVGSHANYGGSSTATSKVRINPVSDVPGISSAMYIGGNGPSIEVTIPDVYHHSSANAFEMEGPNATLNIEFDACIDLRNAIDDGTFTWVVGNKDKIKKTPQSANAFTISPTKEGEIKTTTGGGSLGGSTGFNYGNGVWHRYKIQLYLTNETGAVNKWGLYADGVKIVNARDYSNKVDAINRIRFYITNGNDVPVTSSYMAFSNLSVYKTNGTNPDFSTTDLVLALRKVTPKMSNYRAEGAGTSQLAALETALSNANAVLSTAYTQLNQENINNAATALNTAAAEMDDYLENRYPAGGYQFNQKFDDKTGRAIDVFDIGYAKSVEMNQPKTTLWVCDNLEGITVFKGTNSGTAYDGTWNYENEGPNATLIVEYDLKFDNLSTSGSAFTITITDKEAATALGTYCPITFTPSAYVNIQDGKWYRFRHEIYATNATSGQRARMSLWVNGVSILSNVQFGTYHGTGKETTTSSLWKFPKPDALRFEKSAGNKNGLTFSYDNVSVYKSNVNAAPTVNDGALVHAIREWEEYVKLTGDTTVAAALTSAKAEYNNANRTQASIDSALAALLSATANLEDSERPFVIETFEYADAENNKAYLPSENGKVTGVYVSKNGKYSKDAKMFAAIYSGDMLKSIAAATISSAMELGTTDIIPVTLDLPDDLTDVSVKAFIFDSSDNIKPLSKVKAEAKPQSTDGITVYLAGASITQTYTDADYPQAGWGQMLPNYLDNTVTVSNHAIGGRSTKSFINEGRLNTILNSIKAGDYLFISFAHNDQKTETSRATEPNTTYKEYLYKYISGAREKGAIPVLVTPATRRMFSSNESIGFYGVANMGAYPAAMREVAERYGVPCVDLFAEWAALMENEGSVGSRDYYLILEKNDPRFDQTKLSASGYANGVSDNTHFQEYGADVAAGIIADKLSEINIPLARHVVEGHVPVKPGN